jgi:hypothetical protein
MNVLGHRGIQCLRIMLQTNDWNDGTCEYFAVVPSRGDTVIVNDRSITRRQSLYRVVDVRHETGTTSGEFTHTITLVLEIKQ